MVYTSAGCHHNLITTPIHVMHSFAASSICVITNLYALGMFSMVRFNSASAGEKGDMRLYYVARDEENVGSIKL